MTLPSASVSVQVLLYNLDHAGIVNELCSRRRSGVEARLLLHTQQVKAPSCSQQRLRLMTLVEWGVQLREWSPPGSDYASLHAKAWVVDGGGVCG